MLCCCNMWNNFLDFLENYIYYNHSYSLTTATSTSTIVRPAPASCTTKEDKEILLDLLVEPISIVFEREALLSKQSLVLEEWVSSARDGVPIMGDQVLIGRFVFSK